MFACALLVLALRGQEPEPGVYSSNQSRVYVGVEAGRSDSLTIQYFDSKTHRIGLLKPIANNSYETIDAPVARYTLIHPLVVEERQFMINDGGGALGASFWHAPSLKKRLTIVLVHGADDETRDMGYIIPYFVSHGLNVVTYDQRGTGYSVGDWRYTSPYSKADDIIAILKSLQSDVRFDPNRVGLWGFSNGAWVAPIVATRYPLAFLILKSPPAESIMQNVLYEVDESLRETGQFSDAQITDAINFEQLMFNSVTTNGNWQVASAALITARAQPWFSYTRIPPGLNFPPPAPVLAGLRAALIYDPTAVLSEVHTPTLALFGALDKNVDVTDSEMRLRRDFQAAGNTSLTIRIFPNADHTLVASTTGFEDQPLMPPHVVSGYPDVMIDWLKARDISTSEP